jgi:TolB-like protein/DNA-binding winged helix-turn-helix (wHTH) protein
MRYVIGDLRLDIGRQRATRGEAVIPLPKLSFNLLVALARAAPDLLSCGELLEQVWPKAVVNPETVNQRVRLVRAALGDDAYRPRYIEGLRGRGYRLIPPVHCEAAEPPDTDPLIEQPATAAVAADPAAVSAGAQDPANLSATGAAQQPLPFRATPAAALWLSGLIVTLIAVTASVWALRHEPLLSAATDVGIHAGQPLAIAVLPFQNLSPTADDGYIALGITDAVRQRLASVPQLIVVARSAPFARGVSSPSAVEAGRLLAVRYIVEGSTQRKQNRLRVTAHLIDAQANREIWSLKLERRADALFEVQDEVAEQISRQLAVML